MRRGFGAAAAGLLAYRRGGAGELCMLQPKWREGVVLSTDGKAEHAMEKSRGGCWHEGAEGSTQQLGLSGAKARPPSTTASRKERAHWILALVSAGADCRCWARPTVRPSWASAGDLPSREVEGEGHQMLMAQPWPSREVRTRGRSRDGRRHGERIH
jgi:hypothetical protein